MNSLQFLEGSPRNLGAVTCGDGVNFAVFSKNAERVVLDLFDTPQDKQPSFSFEFDPVKNRTGSIWHVFVKGLSAGALYLYRVDGPYNPPQGHRFNFNKFLFDPYAKSFTSGSVFRSYNKQRALGLAGVENGRLSDLSDFPKCVVVDDSDFDWQGDKPLNYPLYKSVIYETHLKGYTASPTSGVRNPGTYKGFIEKIPYLKNLGITAVEFMPIFEFDEDENNNINPKTGEKLSNYWGYSSVGFFAPKTTYSSDRTPGGPVREFKELVREMHKAGLEVILDVVYNHTAEGNEQGYTFSFRGFENSVYYILPPGEKQYYMNFSGCGNTMNANHPVVTQFIIDSLRYWVMEMHVDGFRFDLASALCRDSAGALQMQAFLVNAIAEDPVLSNTKLIAEPWDCGGGYLVGGFPGGRWSEWNDRYRNDIRRFIRGDEGVVTAAATRIAGSSDLYNHDGRLTTASVNFITAHDGFTLNDLVSFNGKHNDENGENNRDGTDDNNCYNHGFEGITVNPKIEKLRLKKIKNYILCLMLSQGVPMMIAGDEFRRTQNGNNNAYCQDNEVSWINWNLAEKNEELVAFTRRIIQLRKNHQVFHRETFFSTKTPEIEWFDFTGKNPDWSNPSRFLAFMLDGSMCMNDDGKYDSDFYVAGNTDIYDVTITLPSPHKGKKWYLAADTSIEGNDCIAESGKEECIAEQKRYILPAGSFVVLMSK
ncbi:MAG: glycogen debranching protein GlgX [Treponema porcinum]|uniref:glycogen debranching protein GlgX n=1 Tax=Treponema porcinum TaxID=261392 RepID=UPI002352A459|nr:glycogen debranching protein GlgX [Treponema porcinum]MCI6815782.1 glycogen debranching protein GlgX [Treponema porcinum]MCI7080965.1 glycogen debranching protein GlgX [Treponema porcinum]MCI7533653.1 glycogen debranching protein GlgX [Treponema porcinum]MCI7546377.1 glycogen debranching protein GlgX [Treponema porcinum]MDY4189168.1 glycogen debranching protein GlgX [Treponema porcinum]